MFYSTSVVIFTHGERHPASSLSRSSEDAGLFALESLVFWLRSSPEEQQSLNRQVIKVDRNSWAPPTGAFHHMFQLKFQRGSYTVPYLAHAVSGGGSEDPTHPSPGTPETFIDFPFQHTISFSRIKQKPKHLYYNEVFTNYNTKRCKTDHLRVKHLKSI